MRDDKQKFRLARTFAKPSGVAGFYDLYERWHGKDCWYACVTKREIPEGVRIRYDNVKYAR